MWVPRLVQSVWEWLTGTGGERELEKLELLATYFEDRLAQKQRAEKVLGDAAGPVTPYAALEAKGQGAARKAFPCRLCPRASAALLTQALVVAQPTSASKSS